MRELIKLTLVFSLLLGLAQVAPAQTIVTADFSKVTLSTYRYSEGGEPTATEKSGALVFTTDLGASSANTGVRWTQDNASKSTDTNLADYAVSFDLALAKGDLNNVSAGLTIAGTSTDNVSTPIDLSKLSTDGSYAHYSIKLGDLATNEVFNGGNSKLNPTDSSFSFELAVFGNNSGWVTFQLKNFKISRVDKDDSLPSFK